MRVRRVAFAMAFAWFAVAGPVIAAPQPEAPLPPAPGTLVPPPGWKAVSKPLPSVVPGTQYVAPASIDGFAANFNVVETTISYASELARLRGGSPGVRWQLIEDRSSSCTGASARTIGYTYRDGGRELEGLALVASRPNATRTFVVTYTRLRRSPPDPAALRALERYCPHSSGSAPASKRSAS